MENEDLKYPMGSTNRVNKMYNTNSNNANGKQGSANQGTSFNNTSSQGNKKVNFNHNVKNANLNEQQLFNTFQNGFLRNATNFNIGNVYMNADEQENELLSLVLKTPDQSKALLNIFIKDFLDKSGMSKTGKIFEMEQGGEIKQDYDFLIDMERNSINDALEIKRSFLNEWWQIFWDAFNAKAHKNGSKIAQEYYSFNISRKNLDFLCRQASMKAAFEQQILEKKGEYQKEAFKQQAGNPLGFNPFFGAGFESFQNPLQPQSGSQQQPNTSQSISNPRSNEFQYSPSKHGSFEGVALNNAEVLYKIQEQQQIMQQQSRQWNNDVEFGANNNPPRQAFSYNSAQGSPATNVGLKNERSFADDDNLNIADNTNGYDIMGNAGDYGNISHGGTNNIARNNNASGNYKGNTRTNIQTQQMVQQRLNKITPLIKQNEYFPMPNNGMMKVKNGNSNATTPLSNVQNNYFNNPGSAMSTNSNSGLKNINENDMIIQNSSTSNGLNSYISAYDEQLISMEQRLMGNRSNKNGSSTNPGSKSAS